MKNYLKAIIKIFLVLLAYFALQTLVTALFAAIGGAGAEGDIQAAMNDFLAQKASLISLLNNLLVVAVILAFYFKKQSVRAMMAIAPLPGREYLWCALCAVASSIAVSLLITLLPIPDDIMASYSDSITASSGGTFIEHFIATAALAPIAEELFFRGVIYGTLKGVLKPPAAMIISCALFGLLHGQLLWVIYAFLMGVALTLIYDKYRTLLASMAFHIAFNITGSFILPAFGDGLPMLPLLLVMCFGLWYSVRHIKVYNTKA